MWRSSWWTSCRLACAEETSSAWNLCRGQMTPRGSSTGQLVMHFLANEPLDVPVQQLRCGGADLSLRDEGSQNIGERAAVIPNITARDVMHFSVVEDIAKKIPTQKGYIGRVRLALRGEASREVLVRNASCELLIAPPIASSLDAALSSSVLENQEGWWLLKSPNTICYPLSTRRVSKSVA